MGHFWEGNAISFLVIYSFTATLLSRRPIARSFDGLTDRMENRREKTGSGSAQSDAILKKRMESEGLWHVRLDQMDRIRLFISIIARNALWDKHNKNRIRSVGQWERKIGWDLSKHESHPITFVNTNAIKLFKIRQWDAGFKIIQRPPFSVL